MKTKIIFFFFVSAFSFFSCDILRFDLFEVSSWSPGEGYHSDPDNIAISLNFSLDPDKESVEQNFSFDGNGNRIKGTFFWSGKKMSFIPLTPLEPNTDYTISLSADAHDTKGLSLDNGFYCEFTTRQNNERPVLISFYPEKYEVIDDTRMEVRLSFSIPVPLTALYSSVSFNPSMTGSWRLENDDTLAIFTPTEPWALQTRYEVRLSTSLTDNNGMNIGNDFTSVFTVGTDNEAPYLLKAQRITKNNECLDLISSFESSFENDGWEKEDKLFLVFSEPVDWITVRNNLSAVAETAQDIPSFVLESKTETDFIFKFESIPAFESRFTIRLKSGVKDYANNESKEEYVFKIFANGQYSKPPALAGFRMPMAPTETMAPQNETDLQLFSIDTESIFNIIPLSDSYYPSGENISTWIELYFDTAADIDLFSVMDLFRIETTNSVINFSPRQIKTENFSVFEPQPGWEGYQRIEISGILTNSTNFGVIYIQISAGLRDSLENKNEKPQKITVIK